ncbi:hypothetical protein [Protofrankia symbiont of Coriaria ruscifolia]|uniref:hypothetical protein n=1 Tax=Protofrankia symbiont of Coriaria ruscifolia TaxID=1306542 RepID=UPI003242F5BA
MDGYHAVSTHDTYFKYLLALGTDLAGGVNGTSHDLGNGHAVLEYRAPWGRPIAKWEPLFGEDSREEIARMRAELVSRHGEVRGTRMADTNRNLLIYPNLVVNDIMAITVRTFMPLAPDRNPAEPPMIMRDTVLCLADDADPDEIRASIARMVTDVARYVPGYRLKQQVQIAAVGPDEPLRTLIGDVGPRPAWKISIFLEVEGAAHYLPAYAGNLDIMTSAALQTAERLSTVQPPVVAGSAASVVPATSQVAS